MKTDNIEEIAEREEHLFKRIYYCKSEANVVHVEDEENAKESYIDYKRPTQIMMDYEGTISLVHYENELEVIGLIATLIDGDEKIQSLAKKVKQLHDHEIKGGISIPVGAHLFYLEGFKSREEVLGLIERNYQYWRKYLTKIYQNAKGEDNSDLDETEVD